MSFEIAPGKALRSMLEDTSTVTFMPNRLNHQPVIVRGLTANELWMTVNLSAACGLMLGIGLSILARRVAVVPSCIVVAIAAGVFFGGAALRRHKRGRPDTWLQRELQWTIARRLPGLATYLGASELITRSGFWSTRRAIRK